MATFSTAAKALRGPFRKLVRKLEITLRKPVVRKLGPVGKTIDRRLRTKDAQEALRAARKEAAVARTKPRRERPRAVAAAVDTTTGRTVGVGGSGERVDVPASLRSKLPDPSLEPWPADNCAEVAAVSKAMSAGSKFENLIVRTVKTFNDEPFDPCDNCQTWVLGED